jgi:hypothetical protein
MSVASSVINSIDVGQSWVEGQSPVGKIFTITVPTTDVTSNVAVTEVENLSEGVLAITSQFITTSTSDGTSVSTISVSIIPSGVTTPYSQDFYYDVVINNTQTIDMFTTAIVPVTNTENPLTITYVLNWAIGATDPTVSGTITFIRIA